MLFFDEKRGERKLMKKISGDAQSIGQLMGYMRDACGNCGEYLLLPDNKGKRGCQGCGFEEVWEADERDKHTKALEIRMTIYLAGLPDSYPGQRRFQSLAELRRIHRSSWER